MTQPSPKENCVRNILVSSLKKKTNLPKENKTKRAKRQKEIIRRQYLSPPFFYTVTHRHCNFYQIVHHLFCRSGCFWFQHCCKRHRARVNKRLYPPQQTLSHCELITDEGIQELGSASCATDHLEVLELDNCPLITDTSLEHLVGCQVQVRFSCALNNLRSAACLFDVTMPCLTSQCSAWRHNVVDRSSVRFLCIFKPASWKVNGFFNRQSVCFACEVEQLWPNKP